MNYFLLRLVLTGNRQDIVLPVGASHRRCGGLKVLSVLWRRPTSTFIQLTNIYNPKHFQNMKKNYFTIYRFVFVVGVTMVKRKTSRA